ncbi:hypothetical protein GEMRC1_002211 [Eukaryota sp. GEM-RC1]
MTYLFNDPFQFSVHFVQDFPSFVSILKLLFSPLQRTTTRNEQFVELPNYSHFLFRSSKSHLYLLDIPNNTSTPVFSSTKGHITHTAVYGDLCCVVTSSHVFLLTVSHPSTLNLISTSKLPTSLIKGSLSAHFTSSFLIVSSSNGSFSVFSHSLDLLGTLTVDSPTPCLFSVQKDTLHVFSSNYCSFRYHFSLWVVDLGISLEQIKVVANVSNTCSEICVAKTKDSIELIKVLSVTDSDFGILFSDQSFLMVSILASRDKFVKLPQKVVDFCVFDGNVVIVSTQGDSCVMEILDPSTLSPIKSFQNLSINGNSSKILVKSLSTELNNSSLALIDCSSMTGYYYKQIKAEDALEQSIKEHNFALAYRISNSVNIDWFRDRVVIAEFFDLLENNQMDDLSRFLSSKLDTVSADSLVRFGLNFEMFKTVDDLLIYLEYVQGRCSDVVIHDFSPPFTFQSKSQSIISQANHVCDWISNVESFVRFYVQIYGTDLFNVADFYTLVHLHPPQLFKKLLFDCEFSISMIIEFCQLHTLNSKCKSLLLKHSTVISSSQFYHVVNLLPDKFQFLNEFFSHVDVSKNKHLLNCPLEDLSDSQEFINLLNSLEEYLLIKSDDFSFNSFQQLNDEQKLIVALQSGSLVTTNCFDHFLNKLGEQVLCDVIFKYLTTLTEVDLALLTQILNFLTESKVLSSFKIDYLVLNLVQSISTRALDSSTICCLLDFITSLNTEFLFNEIDTLGLANLISSVHRAPIKLSTLLNAKIRSKTLRHFLAGLGSPADLFELISTIDPSFVNELLLQDLVFTVIAQGWLSYALENSSSFQLDHVTKLIHDVFPDVLVQFYRKTKISFGSSTADLIGVFVSDISAFLADCSTLQCECDFLNFIRTKQSLIVTSIPEGFISDIRFKPKVIVDMLVDLVYQKCKKKFDEKFVTKTISPFISISGSVNSYQNFKHLGSCILDHLLHRKVSTSVFSEACIYFTSKCPIDFRTNTCFTCFKRFSPLSLPKHRDVESILLSSLQLYSCDDSIQKVLLDHCDSTEYSSIFQLKGCEYDVAKLYKVETSKVATINEIQASIQDIIQSGAHFDPHLAASDIMESIIKGKYSNNSFLPTFDHFLEMLSHEQLLQLLLKTNQSLVHLNILASVPNFNFDDFISFIFLHFCSSSLLLSFTSENLHRLTPVYLQNLQSFNDMFCERLTPRAQQASTLTLSFLKLVSNDEGLKLFKQFVKSTSLEEVQLFELFTDDLLFKKEFVSLFSHTKFPMFELFCLWKEYGFPISVSEVLHDWSVNFCQNVSSVDVSVVKSLFTAMYIDDDLTLTSIDTSTLNSIQSLAVVALFYRSSSTFSFIRQLIELYSNSSRELLISSHWESLLFNKTDSNSWFELIDLLMTLDESKACALFDLICTLEAHQEGMVCSKPNIAHLFTRILSKTSDESTTEMLVDSLLEIQSINLDDVIEYLMGSLESLSPTVCNVVLSTLSSNQTLSNLNKIQNLSQISDWCFDYQSIIHDFSHFYYRCLLISLNDSNDLYIALLKSLIRDSSLDYSTLQDLVGNSPFSITYTLNDVLIEMCQEFVASESSLQLETLLNHLLCFEPCVKFFHDHLMTSSMESPLVFQVFLDVCKDSLSIEEKKALESRLYMLEISDHPFESILCKKVSEWNSDDFDFVRDNAQLLTNFAQIFNFLNLMEIPFSEEVSSMIICVLRQFLNISSSDISGGQFSKFSELNVLKHLDSSRLISLVSSTNCSDLYKLFLPLIAKDLPFSHLSELWSLFDQSNDEFEAVFVNFIINDCYHNLCRGPFSLNS